MYSTNVHEEVERLGDDGIDVKIKPCTHARTKKSERVTNTEDNPARDCGLGKKKSARAPTWAWRVPQRNEGEHRGAHGANGVEDGRAAQDDGA